MDHRFAIGRSVKPIAEVEGRDEMIAIAHDGDLPHLFERNRAWVKRRTRSDPAFFTRSSGDQRPRYFWIGCSDSHLPPSEIVNLDPGDVFIHRNVANLAIRGDPNFSAALKFAIDILEVRHVIVVGHYGCGGIHAAMGNEADDVIGRWLAPVRMLHRHLSSGGNGADVDANMLCEQNVVSQLRALSHNPIMHAAWCRNQPLTVHGWVHAVNEGLLHSACRPICNAPPFRTRKVSGPEVS